jgi:predicted double-glycine peptidase
MIALPIYLNVLILMAFIALGVSYGKKLFRQEMTLDSTVFLKKAPLIAVFMLIFGIAVVVHAAVAVDPTTGWDFPMLFQIHYTALIWGTLLATLSFICSAVIALAFFTVDKKRWPVLVFALIIVVGVQGLFWTRTRPVAPQLTEEISRGVIMQTSTSSCCAAAAANIAHLFGVEKTEKEMAELFGTTVTGTSPGQVIVGMKKLGFKCRKVNIEDADAKKLNAPAMILIDHIEAGPESHAVSLMKHLNGRVEIWDPLRGKSTPEITRLKGVWHGKAIEISR